MKLLYFTVFITLCASYTLDDYILEFNKQYLSDQQRAERQIIFQQNMASYEIINGQNLGYTVGPTFWTDRTDQQKQQTLRVKVSTDQASSSWTPRNSQLKSTTSTFVNWTTFGLTSVKDQGICGSCWAFSAAAAFQSKLVLDYSINADISEEYLLECTGSQNTCLGGYTVDAMRHLAQFGSPLQSIFPYIALNYTGSQFPFTARICLRNSSTFLKFAQNYTVSSFFRTTKQIILGLLDEGTVATGIIADNAFSSYKTGIYKCNYSYTDNDLNHAVEVVGYNLTGNYYIIKNSWGTKWGQNGYGRIDMTQNCFINRQVYAFVKSLTPNYIQPQSQVFEWRLTLTMMGLIMMITMLIH